ncbi:hypothetical protein Q361_10127 [Flavobacterium croceum DSM 17960]|uniref:Uncharacterized protein n=1 Tax=Flavobacterium croceum DSM 17960 TaxID=1121886 RepID=A0A2S4NB52_9FLAO|nr:hypothetical protein [Flavobacterium croceum]POS02929.1 hypothetical protein Q361_10127 [Flavobacterium croceum DSM 17960]
MKITPTQIQYLYQFTRQRYVEWYDLQTELVDHLANAIEQKRQENPNITFENALELEFKKFGVFGFMTVVEQRQKALSKKYNSILLRHLKAFFTIPKIIITGLIFLLLYFVFYVCTYTQEIALFICLIIITLVLYKQTKFNKYIKNKEKETHKKWLFEQQIFQYANGVAVINFTSPMVQFTNFLTRKEFIYHHYQILFFALLFTCQILLFYIIYFEIPAKAQSYLEQTYPEYNFETI